MQHLKRISLTALISIAMLVPHHMAAQATTTPGTPAIQPAGQPSTPQPDLKVSVECVVGSDDQCTDSSSEMLGHHLKLKVANLSEWAKTNSPWKLILFLNGRQLSKTYPVAVYPDKNQLIFKLVRTDDSAAAWDDLIVREKNWRNWLTKGVSRDVRPSVGLEGTLAGNTNGEFELVLLSPVWVYVCGAFWLGTLIGLCVLARKSSLLRDNPGGPYSLARTQMAVWSWELISAYFFLFVMSWDPAVDIPVSMLGLLGISATTYVAATLVDRGESAASRQGSKGFLRDISGGEGVSLHRIQIIAWTVVLVFVFTVQVFTKLTIPDFNPTLLGLLGLSAGTYVGFKFPENLSPASTQTQSATVPPIAPPRSAAATAAGAGGSVVNPNPAGQPGQK